MGATGKSFWPFSYGHIRAILFHLEKIKKYGNLINAYRRREEYKTNVFEVC
jgi:hypothetical protein